MAVVDIPIVGQSYHLNDWAVDCQRTLNLYPQAVESGNTRSVSALLQTEGLVKRFDFGDVGAIRGLYAVADVVLCVAGQTLYVIKENQPVLVGEILGFGLVQFADNSLQVMLVTDGYCYQYTLETGELSLIEIGDDFMGAGSVTFLDSRFIWSVPKSGKIQWSNLLSTKSTALSYATAESRSDNLVRVVACNGQLWLIGEKTTEIWNTTGSSDSPFIRQSGAYIPLGCMAKNSVAVFGASLIWLAQSEHGHCQVVMSQGYQAQRISNHAIEQEISGYARVDNAYAFSYQREGHNFYVISFPTAQKTWVFDSATGVWHERSFFNWALAKHEHHRAVCHCFNGEHWVGDRKRAIVYCLDDKAESDNGHVIVRERVTPCISPHGQRLIFDELQVFCQVGQKSDSEPKILLDWSDDGGVTWSNDRMGSIGAMGEFKKRVIFRRLGQSFNRVFRLRMTDTGRLVVTGAKVKVR